MSPAALDNANPTILNASELPTRKRSALGRKGPDSRYADVIFARPPYLLPPFCDTDDDDNDNGAARTASPATSWPSSVDDDLDPADDDVVEPIDEQEIYDLISTITDPEHPVSLGQLSVVNLADIHLNPPPASTGHSSRSLVEVLVEITPTITHCSLATILGLAVRVRLERCLPPAYRVDVRCRPSSHVQDDQVNKQLADKERVAAALENDSLRAVLDKMLETCH